jgi:hypothetical protein
MNRRLRIAGALAAGAMTIAACGATPPQAPPAAARQLDRATSGISTACGEAFQVTAFAGDHAADLATLEATAAAAAGKLARVDARNPAWIYQGQTVSEIVHDSIGDLRSCHLTRSAMALVRRAGAG